MKPRGRIGDRAGLWALLSLLTLGTACREPPAAQGLHASDSGIAPSVEIPLAPGLATPAMQPGSSEIEPTDADLTTDLTGLRGWKRLTNRHRSELDAAGKQAAAKLPLHETGRIAHDPDLLALVERHRTEMQAHFDRIPKGATAEALRATLSGIGTMVAQPTGMVYVQRRDESALAAARKSYGDAFVDWVLERESTVAVTLER